MENRFYKWMVLVNITLILIEIFITNRYVNIVDTIFDKLEQYLFFNYDLSDDNDLIKQDLLIDYLNDIELLNKYSFNWDESFCALELLKAMRYLSVNDLENSKKSIENYKRLYKMSNYVNELKVFKTLNHFYDCVKIQLYYFQDSICKCNKRLEKLYKLTEIKGFKIGINEKTIRNEYNVNEYVLYYYNTQGIISLKLKKYQNAEYLFKVCIKLYKKFYDNNDFSIRLNWILSFKYNLALAYFYQKRYDKAYEIYIELVKHQNFNLNIYLWYRLGLCCLELYLQKLRLCNQDTQSDLISKIYGFEYNNDIESEEDYFKDIPDDDSETQTKNEKKMKCKRIILRNNFNKVDNKLLLEAIYYLKQVINIEKTNINNTIFSKNEEASKIFNFYSLQEKNFDEVNKQYYKNTNQILTSTYLNLLYSFSLNENWNEILFYHSEYEKTSYYKSDSRETILRFDNFKIEALINLKEDIKATELLNNNINLIYTGDMKASYLSKVNYVVYNEISFKFSLLVNLTKLHFVNNNLIEAEKCINSLLGLFGSNMNDIPSIVHNILIYFHLVKGNTKNVFQILKYRKVSSINCINK